MAKIPRRLSSQPGKVSGQSQLVFIQLQSHVGHWKCPLNKHVLLPLSSPNVCFCLLLDLPVEEKVLAQQTQSKSGLHHWYSLGPRYFYSRSLCPTFSIYKRWVEIYGSDSQTENSGVTCHNLHCCFVLFSVFRKVSRVWGNTLAPTHKHSPSKYMNIMRVCHFRSSLTIPGWDLVLGLTLLVSELFGIENCRYWLVNKYYSLKIKLLLPLRH